MDRRLLEILHAVEDRRLHVHTVSGEKHASYDNVPSDRYDGSLCTDEVNVLIESGHVRYAGEKLRLTGAGRTRLVNSTRER